MVWPHSADAAANSAGRVLCSEIDSVFDGLASLFNKRGPGDSKTAANSAGRVLSCQIHEVFDGLASLYKCCGLASLYRRGRGDSKTAASSGGGVLCCQVHEVFDGLASLNKCCRGDTKTSASSAWSGLTLQTLPRRQENCCQFRGHSSVL